MDSTLVHKDDVLAEASGGFNAISIYGHALGTPASTAAVPARCRRPARVLPTDQLRSRYYLRVTTKDELGVMAHASQALASKASASPRSCNENESKLVPVLITTHLAQEGAVRRALQQIDASPMIGAPTVCLRVIDQPKEFAGSTT